MIKSNLQKINRTQSCHERSCKYSHPSLSTFFIEYITYLFILNNKYIYVVRQYLIQCVIIYFKNLKLKIIM